MGVRQNSYALILGGGPLVWGEAKQAFETFDVSFVMAVNTAMMDYPGEIDAGITFHPKKLPYWLPRRYDRFYPKIPEIISHRQEKYVTNIEPYKVLGLTQSGSSGLFAITTLMRRGYDKIILAGVPMNIQPHYYDDKPWNDYRTFMAAWRSILPTLQGKVKSYSGWTAEKLGTPEDWR